MQLLSRWESSVIILVCCAFVFLNFFSLRTLTTQPAYWYDEGINVEMARNFAASGHLDVIVAPNTYSHEGAFLGSTGYTTTVPLALFYKVFGFGLEQSRLYMLLWMNLLLLVVFLFAKKQWGDRAALLATIFFVTYPPFYGNGRTVMGEIPGFFFLLLSLQFFIEKRSIALVGLFAGLAAVSKPSVFAFVLPVYAVLYVLEHDTKHVAAALKNVVRFGLASLLALIPWIALYVGIAFAPGTWTRIGEHFANPYAAAGYTVLGNIKTNLHTFFFTGTLVYMVAIALVVMLAAFWNKSWRVHNRAILLFTLLYSPCALLYYLKSVGYLRYLIAAQFLLLLLVVPALIALAELLRPNLRRAFLVVSIGALLLFQGVYLFTSAKLFYSEQAQTTIAYVESHYPHATFGVINLPTIASLLPADRTYDFISTYGLTGTGVNFVQLPPAQLPTVAFVDTDKDPAVALVLQRYYMPVTELTSGIKTFVLKQ